MDRDCQFLSLDLPFYDGRKPAFLRRVHVRTSAHDLRPTPAAGRSIVTIDVLMGGNHELAAGLVQDRPPELGASTLPYGKIMLVAGILVSRCDIARISRGIGIKQRDVAESHQEGRLRDIFPLQNILQPGHLGLAILSAVEKTGKPWIGIHLPS